MATEGQCPPVEGQKRSFLAGTKGVSSGVCELL